MRLDDERVAVKIETLGQLLKNHSDQLTGRFVVVTESKVRFARA